jgi:hypothetical protein
LVHFRSGVPFSCPGGLTLYAVHAVVNSPQALARNGHCIAEIGITFSGQIDQLLKE